MFHNHWAMSIFVCKTGSAASRTSSNVRPRLCSVQSAFQTDLHQVFKRKLPTTKISRSYNHVKQYTSRTRDVNLFNHTIDLSLWSKTKLITNSAGFCRPVRLSRSTIDCRFYTTLNCVFNFENLPIKQNLINLSQKRNLFQPAFRKRVNLKHLMAEKEDWMVLGSFRVYPWSISGLDTCITVQTEDKVKLAFDMGYSNRESIGCQNVFISHGHIDHVSGLIQHASRRSLYSMKPATYHIPSHLITGMKTVAQGFAMMHENMDCLKNIKFNLVDTSDTIKIQNNWIAKPFPTKHRVNSQGYILYKEKKRLKEQYKGLASKDIAQLVHEGTVVNDIEQIPMLAYTGDTTFDVFQELHNPDLLRVQVLITEATYIDDDFDSQGRSNVQKARDRGHCHLREFIDNAWIFRDVQNILFVHFSDKYSVDYIHETVDNILPPMLKRKVHLGTLAKEKYG